MIAFKIMLTRYSERIYNPMHYTDTTSIWEYIYEEYLQPNH